MATLRSNGQVILCFAHVIYLFLIFINTLFFHALIFDAEEHGQWDFCHDIGIWCNL